MTRMTSMFGRFAISAFFAASPAVSSAASSSPPDFGPNVIVFDPGMPTSQIQATVDAVASLQVSNQFGTERYALLFKPGTYGSAAVPLNFQVGYYTASVSRRATSSSPVTLRGTAA